MDMDYTKDFFEQLIEKEHEINAYYDESKDVQYIYMFEGFDLAKAYYTELLESGIGSTWYYQYNEYQSDKWNFFNCLSTKLEREIDRYLNAALYNCFDAQTDLFKAKGMYVVLRLSNHSKILSV